MALHGRGDNACFCSVPPLRKEGQHNASRRVTLTWAQGRVGRCLEFSTALEAGGWVPTRLCQPSLVVGPWKDCASSDSGRLSYETGIEAHSPRVRG